MPGQSPGPQIQRDREEMLQSGEEKGLDQQLWQACAGSMVHLPLVGSRVVYFPQGHAEQAQSSPEFPRSLSPSGTLPCRLLSVKFLADRETDEVFAKMKLQPEPPGSFDAADDNDSGAASPAASEKPTSFAKTLTQSDANNGGGFSVPRYCAETIFPKLDYTVDPPVQTVFAKDVHGEVWKFRHIYRGTPRRHLLTTGWSTFVNQKKLVAGDAIVFLRTSSGELCVGVRRSMRGGAGNADAMLWHSNRAGSSRWELRPQQEMSNYDAESGGGGGASRGGGGGGGSSFVRNRPKVSAKSVLEAATLAAAGKAFEVVYYPRASTAEFCVRAQTVRSSLAHAWYPGMRFKMAFETEDSSRISWFMGTISAIQPADCVQWPKSPWRVLQVAWDEPDLLQGVGRVSPWQVELVSTLPMQLPPFSLPRKKFRASQPLFAEGQSFPVSPAAAAMGSGSILAVAAAAGGGGGGSGGGGGVLGQMNPWHGLSDETPAGMQGARHERLYGLTFSDCRPNNRLHPGLLDNNNASTTGASAATTTTTTNNYVYQQQQQPQTAPSAVVEVDATALSYGATDLRLGMQVVDVQRINSTNNNNSQNDSSASSDNRHGVGGGGGTITLFGKKIETSGVTPQEQQNSASGGGGSSSETTTSLQQQLQASSSGESQNNEGGVEGDIGSLKWFKKHASVLSSEEKDRLEGNSEDLQCKVFLESEDVGRTLELPSLRSYEELYDRLASMFFMDKGQLSGRVVYQDLEGSTIHVGGEPYMNFMKSVRRLTILADNASSSNVNNNNNNTL